MGGQPLYLEPRLGSRLGSLLESPRLLHSLTEALGSPLNVVIPDQIADNVEQFRSVYARHHLSGQVFFAHKANRSSALLRRLAATDAGVDVASLGELQHALGAGFTPDRITATGPKNPEFLWLAARTSVTVSVDGRVELDQLAALVRRFTLPRVRILLRLSGFEASGVRVLSRRSRFGTPAQAVKSLLEAVELHRDAVEPVGVAYHLDTTSLDEKATALEGCLRVLEECRDRGLRPQVVDVGGGNGSLLVALLGRQPGLRGIVFDLPETVVDRASLGDRITFLAGDFFDRVPAGDVYVLSTVLHDWDDERAAAILRTIRRTAAPDARLVILDAVVSAGNEPHGAKWLDLLMLALFGGRERDETEWRTLLHATGFEPVRFGERMIEAECR